MVNYVQKRRKSDKKSVQEPRLFVVRKWYSKCRRSAKNVKCASLQENKDAQQNERRKGFGKFNLHIGK